MLPVFKCISAVCALSAVLTAADPFVGTWRLNVKKSDLGNVKSGRTSYVAMGDGYVYDAEIVFADSTVSRLHGPVQFDGTRDEEPHGLAIIRPYMLLLYRQGEAGTR